MIIIKTKTGDIFVNDREMVNVTHNRELHTADIHDGKATGMLWHKPPIEHVESVVYINEQTAKEWKDNGSELEYLRKEMESLKLELQCQTEITKNTKERLLQSIIFSREILRAFVIFSISARVEVEMKLTIQFVEERLRCCPQVGGAAEHSFSKSAIPCHLFHIA